MASHEEIEKLAYELWEKDSTKKDSTHYWLQAESFLNWQGEFFGTDSLSEDFNIYPIDLLISVFQYESPLIFDPDWAERNPNSYRTKNYKNIYWKQEGF